MTGIKDYFTSLTATALIGVLATALIKDQRIRSILQIVTGVLLLLVLLKPVAGIDMKEFAQDMDARLRQELSTDEYEALYKENLRKQIQKTTEEYIRKKAESLGAVATAQVTLSTEDYPTPIGVRVYGSFTAEQKSALQDYLTEELGIPQENQRWESYG